MTFWFKLTHLELTPHWIVLLGIALVTGGLVLPLSGDIFHLSTSTTPMTELGNIFILSGLIFMVGGLIQARGE